MRVAAIHSVPRSGSTWLGEIINSSSLVAYKYQPLFSYKFKDALSPESSVKEIDAFFHELLISNDEFIEQIAARENGKLPTFIKGETSELVYKEVRYHHILRNLLEKPGIRILLLIRNPLEVLDSWQKAPREFRVDLGWDFRKEWRFAHAKNQGRPEEFYGFEKWKESSNMFLDLQQDFPEQVRIVEYKNLVNDTHKTAAGVFHFLSLPLEQQTIDFINLSRTTNNTDEYSVFKDSESLTGNGWQETLPGNIIEEVTEDLADGRLEKFLYQ